MEEGRPTGTCAFSHCGNSGGIAAESGDVLLHPLEGKKLVSKAIITHALVACGFIVPSDIVRGQEAQDTETIATSAGVSATFSIERSMQWALT